MARLTAVVVLPTPPFPDAIAIDLLNSLFKAEFGFRIISLKH